jgi:hypothetical protein
MNAWAEMVLLDPASDTPERVEEQDVGQVSPRSSGKRGKASGAKAPLPPEQWKERPSINRLESKHGKSLREICEPYAAQGYSKTEVGRILGLNVCTMRIAVDERCPDLPWPALNRSRSRQEAWGGISKKLRAHGVKTFIGDEPMVDVARRLGISYDTLRSRRRRGKDESELVRKPKRRTRKKETYRVGYSIREWKQVLDLIKETQGNGGYVRAKKRVAKKLGIDYGAITAVEKGQWWRIS